MIENDFETMPVGTYPFERFFEISPDLLCIAGFDGYFRQVNPAVINLLGYDASELYSRPINDFVFEDDKHITAEARSAIVNNNPLLHFENRYVTRSGQVVWLSWTSMPVPEHQVVFAIAKNITHKKKLEEERNLALSRLKNINNHLNQLTYTTSHDLRAPINNMLLVFDLLDMTNIQDQDAIQLLRILRSSSEGLKGLLNNYVDQLGERENKWHPATQVRFEDCLNRVLHSIQALIDGSQATIEANFSQASEVVFNEHYLYSIFLNLVTNSIKYKRPDIAPLITVKTEIAEGAIQLTVSDNGRGFDDAVVKDRIFGAYQTFHDQHDSKGIGLYLVHQHVTNLGGTIQVQSQPNEGATFTIHFKL